MYNILGIHGFQFFIPWKIPFDTSHLHREFCEVLLSACSKLKSADIIVKFLLKQYLFKPLERYLESCKTFVLFT